MRTVSFSSPDVQKKMNQDFVCVAVNTEGDPSAGSSQAHAPADRAGQCAPGIGNQNVQMIFMTPDRRIFHTASGFHDAKALEREMEFAEDLFEKIQKSPRLAERVVREDHHDQMIKAGYSPQTLQRASQLVSPFGRLQAGITGFPRTSQPSRSDMPINIFARKTEQTRMLDYQFSQKYPMLAWDQFEENPRLLVGEAVTAFASGNASGGRIGGDSPRNVSASQESGGQRSR